MRKMCNIIVAILFSFIAMSVNAQTAFFADKGQNVSVQTEGRRMIVPDRFRTSELNVAALKSFLWALPSEENVISNRSTAQVIALPMPDGTMARFKIWESSIQEPALQARFSEIRTFRGQGIDDPYATIRCDFNPFFGFSAQILSPSGRIYIDPYAKRDTKNYISYYQRDYIRSSSFKCGVTDTPIDVAGLEGKVEAGPCRGTQLRTYRLAVACTAEYSAAVAGGDVAGTHAAIVNTVNRVTGVYEVELAIRMVLVANNSLIEYTANPDPYTNVVSTDQLTANQTNIDAVIGSGNYDIGHLFTSDDNGVAILRSVCTSSKAKGATGSPDLIGDGYAIDYVAHEMGHQFGANHTFNSNTCASAGGSYEPGGGTTIMAYAGICAASENIQPNSDPIFHPMSFDEISNYVTTGSGSLCGVLSNTGNNLPVITSMPANNISIPINTPFTLTATATDPDGDPITYNWDGWDFGPAGTWTSAVNSSTRPLFRTRVSKLTGSRTFPDIRVIAANYPGTSAPSAMDGLRGEVLPAIARTMKFRLTVRDVHNGIGGVVSAGDGCQDAQIFQVNAVGTSPFAVVSPNGGESYPGGSTQTITWSVANTNVAPINCTNVKISMSTDGGLTYNTVLAASTPNDGSEAVVIPVGTTTTTTARIKIEALDNIFFDISNQNFSVTPPVDGFEFSTPATQTVACAGPTSASITLATTTVDGFTTPIDLVASGNPVGTTVSFSSNPLTPGSSTIVTLNGTNTLFNGSYNITVTGTAGAQVRTRVLTFVVQTGTGPTVNTQPTNQAVCVGSNATFSAAFTGAVSYQWQVSTDGGTNYANVPAGGNGTSYTVNSVTTAFNNYRYRILANGQCGITTSAFATLTVQTAPSISAVPQSATLCEASNATFNVTAAGTGLSYQWQSSTDGNTFTDIASANSNSYTVNNITPSVSGSQYRVVVSGTCPSPATSSAAALTVISPVQIVASPQSIAECETGNVSFSVTGAGTGVLYKWQRSVDGVAAFEDVANGGVYSGAATSTLTLTNLPANYNNYRYRAQVYNTICTSPATSGVAILTVNPRPVVTLTAPSLNLQPGQTSTITAGIQPAAPGFNITWFRNDTQIPGVTGTSFTADVTTLGDYRVAINNPTTGCSNQSQVLTIGAQASQRLFIYPNPSTGQFTVSYYNSAWSNSRQTLTIYNSQGSRIYSAAFNLTGPYTLLPVNLNGAGGGVYLVVLGDTNGKKIIEGKVIIGH
ncbi:MAG: T9SS type A sorting domain-containing protein [Sphingobacteriales bacterium]|nr:T9SS type A sorting domain-containing protein [Sphingobacteriales bacterium]